MNLWHFTGDETWAQVKFEPKLDNDINKKFWIAKNMTQLKIGLSNRFGQKFLRCGNRPCTRVLVKKLAGSQLCLVITHSEYYEP